jgi:phosphatidylserine/phosphatidylglycerophosphate/cardiolipin synthase-like enzyme
MFHDIGIKIKFNTIARNSMHCKFIVIDNKILIEGSMNMGKKSLENYEHITVTREQTAIDSFAER